MIKARTEAVRHLDQLLRCGIVGETADPQLLEQFVAGNDEGAALAFEAIVERHGPMVLRVCRTVLRDAHAADDAFQATFLVLARKARTLRQRELLSNWLYGVAARTARKAKAIAAQRRAQDLQAAQRRTISAVEPAHDDGSDWEQVLHEEIDRLPRQFRVAVVNCYLEGLTQAQAARQLCLDESTIRGRLARARKLLRERLTRRGVAPPAVLFPLSSARKALADPLPTAIARTIARGALLFLNRGQAMPGGVSVTAQGLASGVLYTMWLSQIKTLAAVLVTTALLTAGALLLTQKVVEARPQGVPPQFVTAAQSVSPAPAAGQETDAKSPAEAQTAKRKKRQQPSKTSDLDPQLVKLALGPILRTVPVSKDCTVLAYMPDWNHGNIDNIGIQNGGGGVRILLDWPAIPVEEAASPERQFVIAIYSRKTQSSPPAGPILAFEFLEGWRELTSWKTLPKYHPEPVGTYKLEPGDGWKLFDITSLVRAQAKDGRNNNGILLRFLSEDVSGPALSGYEGVSREGTGEWANRRPLLLVVQATKS